MKILLGQTAGAMSTTAADYSIRVADETEVYYCNPKTINLIYCNEWRSYREFNKDFDRWEITTYFEADLVTPVPETMVKFVRVRAPQITW